MSKQTNTQAQTQKQTYKRTIVRSCTHVTNYTQRHIDFLSSIAKWVGGLQIERKNKLPLGAPSIAESTVKLNNFTVFS
jgi:hypothetical protein